jgi:hypothetical protein
MNNLTEDIRSDLTKIFSERNEVVAEEHVPSETVAEYAEEVQTYLTDIGVNFDDERAKELSEKMDTVLTFIYKNSSSSYLDT